MGRVSALEVDKIILDGGVLETSPDIVHVDCSASLSRTMPTARKIDRTWHRESRKNRSNIFENRLEIGPKTGPGSVRELPRCILGASRSVQERLGASQRRPGASRSHFETSPPKKMMAIRFLFENSHNLFFEGVIFEPGFGFFVIF